MKLQLLGSILCLCFITTALSAQNFHLRFGGGYSISTSNDVFTMTNLTVDSNGVATAEENIYGTIGSGAHFRATGGYTFSSNVGVELEVNYLWGERKLAGGIYPPTDRRETFASTRQLRISPSLIILANPNFIQPYMGMGITLPVVGKTVTEEFRYSGDNFTEKVTEIRGDVSVGFHAFTGVNIQWPNERFRLFAEIRYTGLRIKSKTAEVVRWAEYDSNNEQIDNILEASSVAFTNIEFRDRVTLEDNIFSANLVSPDFDFNEPMNLLARKSNFNALGVNIGVRMDLVKKEALD